MLLYKKVVLFVLVVVKNQFLGLSPPPKKNPYFRAMNHTSTHPPKSLRPANGGYRYFFNGQEVDNEVLGEGALHAFEYRMHDTRIVRFWSVDPMASKYPSLSPYVYCANNPVKLVDPKVKKYMNLMNPESFFGLVAKKVVQIILLLENQMEVSF